MDDLKAPSDVRTNHLDYPLVGGCSEKTSSIMYEKGRRPPSAPHFVPANATTNLYKCFKRNDFFLTWIKV